MIYETFAQTDSLPHRLLVLEADGSVSFESDDLGEGFLGFVGAYDDVLIEGTPGTEQIVFGTDFSTGVVIEAGSTIVSWQPGVPGVGDRRRFTILDTVGMGFAVVDYRELTYELLPDALQADRAPRLSPGALWLAAPSETSVMVVRPDNQLMTAASVELDVGWEVRTVRFIDDQLLRVVASSEAGGMAILDVDLDDQTAEPLMLGPEVSRVIHPGNAAAIVVADSEGSTVVLSLDDLSPIYTHGASLSAAPEVFADRVLLRDRDGWTDLDVTTGSARPLPMDLDRHSSLYRVGDLVIFSHNNGSTDSVDLVLYDGDRGAVVNIGKAIGPIDGFSSNSETRMTAAGDGLVSLRDGEDRAFIAFDPDGIVAERRFSSGSALLGFSGTEVLLSIPGNEPMTTDLVIWAPAQDSMRLLATLPEGRAVAWATAPR